MSTWNGATAVILAGGLGTRLRPVLAGRPKVLAQVMGKPFLAYVLEQVAALGVGHVVLCVGYLGEQIRSALGEAYAGMHLAYSQESSPLGTAGALRLAMPQIKSEVVLVMNGDSYCQADLEAFRAWHFARGASASLLLTELADTRRYGRVQVDEEGVVLGFDEKGGIGGSGWISAGIYLLSRRLLQAIPTNRSVSLEVEIFPAWINQGLYGYRSVGPFLDIGTPEAYALAGQFFAPETPA